MLFDNSSSTNRVLLQLYIIILFPYKNIKRFFRTLKGKYERVENCHADIYFSSLLSQLYFDGCSEGQAVKVSQQQRTHHQQQEDEHLCQLLKYSILMF